MVCTNHFTLIHFAVNFFSILMYFSSRLIRNMCQGENSYFQDEFYAKVHISITHDGRSMPENVKKLFNKSPHPSPQVQWQVTIVPSVMLTPCKRVLSSSPL